MGYGSFGGLKLPDLKAVFEIEIAYDDVVKLKKISDYLGKPIPQIVQSYISKGVEKDMIQEKQQITDSETIDGNKPSTTLQDTFRSASKST